MHQPINNKKNIVRTHTNGGKKLRKVNTDNINSSKLEDYFIKNYLEPFGIKYIRQYEAKSIGRFFDLFLPDNRVLIEIDGGYWHSDPRKYKNKQLNETQLKNKKVDKIKNEWALYNCIPLYRFWEDDILYNSKVIFEKLKIKK